MITKIKKTFDAVQMVREIRDAYYLSRTKKDFDNSIFEEIKKNVSGLRQAQTDIHFHNYHLDSES